MGGKHNAINKKMDDFLGVSTALWVYFWKLFLKGHNGWTI